MDSTWYRGVIVGVDGSHESTAALRWAAYAADLHGARLTVVAAHPVPPEAGPGLSSLIEDAHEHARRAADVAREQLGTRRPGGQDVETLVLPGNAARVLVQRSTVDDLVVVGRRRLGAFDRALLGSTSSALAAAVSGTVAVVPASVLTEVPRRIRVGVGPVDEPDVLGTAFAEAGARGCTLEVLHVTGTDPMSSALLDGDPLASSWREAAVTDLSDRLARWSDKYQKVSYTVMIRRGDPITTLLRGLSQEDVLVLGGRHHSAVTGRLLRSVPDAVLRAAPCPVMVVHAHRQPAAEEIVRGTRAAQQIMGLRESVRMEELGDFFPRAMTTAGKALAAQGVAPTGPPVALYQGMADEKFDVTAGFPVPAGAAPSGDVVVATLPAGATVEAIHQGSYDGLSTTYEKLTEWFKENGITPPTVMWEEYLVGPESGADPSHWQTRIVYPVD